MTFFRELRQFTEKNPGYIPALISIVVLGLGLAFTVIMFGVIVYNGGFGGG